MGTIPVWTYATLAPHGTYCPDNNLTPRRAADNLKTKAKISYKLNKLKYNENEAMYHEPK
jgi:hypothetical protein